VIVAGTLDRNCGALVFPDVIVNSVWEIATDDPPKLLAQMPAIVAIV
jgi:branched-subunit amino acid transport protein